METLKHTESPWEADFTRNYSVKDVIRHNGIIVAVLPISVTDKSGEREANAKLIAAAPDLLAALRELEQLVTAHIPDEADNWCRSARIVLAKLEDK